MPASLALREPALPADSDQPFTDLPLRRPAAHIIRNDAEALEAARRVAVVIARDGVVRDRERRLPHAELDLISDAGILAITVPKAFGGAGVSAGTLAEVVAILSEADGSIGQIPQNHFFILEALRLQGTPEQQR
jgi:alkylation response protein AidB-like acyl-CoA dehydrogenase